MKDRPAMKWWKKRDRREQEEIIDFAFAQRNVSTDAVDERRCPNWAPCPVRPLTSRVARGRGSKAVYNNAVDRIRREEYPHMKQGAYLDHGGATIYAKSLVTSFANEMMANLWGNPHSENTPARQSGDMVDKVRAQTLQFFGADPEHFDLVFVANATAAIKLVADSFRDIGDKTSTGGFWYGYHSEVHTSLVGVRELAGDDYCCFENDSDVESWLSSAGRDADEEGEASSSQRRKRPGLFAYPGQSNMTGRRLPRNWTRRIRWNPRLRNTYTLFDAAALAMTSNLAPLFANPDAAPDFTCLSLYKIFGFPDLGALIVRKASGHTLNLRRYYGGGTIAHVFPLSGSGKRGSTVKKMPDAGLQGGSWSLHEGLEDGTLPFHSILALGDAIETHQRLYGSMDTISRHCAYLSQILFQGLKSLRHPNGRALVELYIDEQITMDTLPSKQGSTFAFNVLRPDGSYVPWTEVEKTANDSKVYIRAGGVCNPGGVSKALLYKQWEWSRMFTQGHYCGSKDTAVVNGKPTGIVRASMGAMTTKADVAALLLFLHRTYIAQR